MIIMRRCLKYLFVAAFILLVISSAAHSRDSISQNSISDPNKETVVLLHGLGRSKSAMWLLASRLEDTGYTVVRIGYSSLHESPENILLDVSKQIDACCKKLLQPVHFVGHSLGGLLIRAYLDDNRIKHLGRVVLMGTPNQGTPVVDHFRDTWWFKIVGPTALALGTDVNSFPNSLQPPYYPVGIIAGEIDFNANDTMIPGKDDGLVPVESTRISNMTDFIIISTGHSMMRYNDDVARQAIHFLRVGRFKNTYKKLKNEGERN